MKYISTRNKDIGHSLEDALRRGLAKDGGLFVPASFPRIYDSAKTFPEAYPEFARQVFAPFFEQSVLQPHLEEICKNTFTFDLPLREMGEEDKTTLLELFWGPTAAFKDVGARFLANCFAALQQTNPAANELTILVATSGDTGGAVASAFHHQPDIRVLILFPDKGVAPRQRQQLTAFDGNVTSVAVEGTFDDCQRLVKEAFADTALTEKHQLTSANSINIGRLLPQSIYYAHASASYFRTHQRCPNFIIPSGNVGNATAALWAKKMGFPIGQIIMTNNANDVVAEAFRSMIFSPRASITTLANAMDVGNPSNMERLLFSVDGKMESLQKDMAADSVADDEIEKQIKKVKSVYGEIICPHTATAFEIRERHAIADSICVATAHPAKFPEIVEPLINEVITIPDSLASILKKPTSNEFMAPQLQDLDAILSRKPAP
ncbi:MAG: threonine synthase [Pirellulaceae bacterium]|nr:threonine synthase [Pirellulaceae bacterium]